MAAVLVKRSVTCDDMTLKRFAFVLRQTYVQVMEFQNDRAFLRSKRLAFFSSRIPPPSGEDWIA